MDRAYFVRSDSFSSKSKKTIYYVDKDKNDNWSTPLPVSFSGNYSDGGIYLSWDNKKMYFHSDRPIQNELKSDSDLWFVEKVGDGWGNPVHMGPIVNSLENEYSPSIAKNGNLYFGSTREGGYGWGDLYVSELTNGQYQKPINLGPNINFSEGEWGSVISDDESFIIFEANGREENISYAGDLYIAYKTNGTWNRAINLTSINSSGSDLAPRFSPDRKHLYFSSNGDSHSSKFHNVKIYYTNLNELLEGIK